MSRRVILGLSAAAVLELGLMPSAGFAQTAGLKEQLVGTWLLVSHDVVAPDGKKTSDLGPTPNGTIIFDASGHYALVFNDSNRPKWKSANRNQATPEDFKSAFLGTIAQAGTWSVDADGKTIAFKVTSALNPNVEGRENKVSAVVMDDELHVTEINPATGNTVQIVERRAK